MIFWALGVEAVRRDHVPREGLAGERVPQRDGRAREVAGAHGRGRDVGPSAAVDRLLVRALVVQEEERLVALDRAAEARAPAVRVRVRVGVAPLGAGLLLVVGQRVQAVGVVVVERRALVAVAAALGRDDDAREASVLGAVRVGEHLDLGNGVEARGRIADRPEDGVRGGLAVLDVGDAVGPAAQELDVVIAAEDVRVQRQEVLYVAAVAGEVPQLLGVEAHGDGRALEHDVVESLGGDGDRLRDRAELELHVDARDPGGPHNDAVLLVLLEAGGHHLDPVAARPEVGGLVATVGVGVDGPGHPGGLVHDQHGGIRNRRPLGIRHGAADRSQDRLSAEWRRDRRERQKHQEHQSPRRGRPRPERGYERMSSHLFLLGIPPITGVSSPAREIRFGRPRRRNRTPAGSHRFRLSYERKQQLVLLSSPFLFVCQSVFLRQDP